MTRGHPHYVNDPSRPMLCNDNVSKGEARGVITAISTGDRTKVRVNWGGGFTDEQPRALFYEAEPPKVEWITSLPLGVHNRLVDGYHTDADEVALLDAYRRGAIAAEIVDEPDPLLAVVPNGGRR